MYPNLNRVCLTLIPGVSNTRPGMSNTDLGEQAPEIPDLVEEELGKGTQKAGLEV